MVMDIDGNRIEIGIWTILTIITFSVSIWGLSINNPDAQFGGFAGLIAGFLSLLVCFTLYFRRSKQKNKPLTEIREWD